MDLHNLDLLAYAQALPGTAQEIACTIEKFYADCESEELYPQACFDAAVATDSCDSDELSLQAWAADDDAAGADVEVDSSPPPPPAKLTATPSPTSPDRPWAGRLRNTHKRGSA